MVRRNNEIIKKIKKLNQTECGELILSLVNVKYYLKTFRAKYSHHYNLIKLLDEYEQLLKPYFDEFKI